jgi:hypothetical protein
LLPECLFAYRLFLFFASGGQGLFLLIPSETLFFWQTFEMKPLKNGIRLTVKRVGSPTPFLKKPPLDPAKTFDKPLRGL